MKSILTTAVLVSLLSINAQAQINPEAKHDGATAASDTSVTVLTLEDALKIALSENVAVKVAEKEIERVGYARRGSYAALFPQIDGSAAYQRTIKKQVMYMDGDSFNFGSMIGDALMGYLLPLYAQHPGVMPPVPETPAEEEKSSNDGIAVGRWNTWSAGVSAAMPLVNFQLWESIRLSGVDVELAVEKARSSRLDMVSQVKQAFVAVLIAKQSREVYEEVFNNAAENFKLVEMKYKAQKASELEYTRSKATFQSAVPNLYNAEASIDIALWQLKAVMGIDLDENVDVAGSLQDFVGTMLENVMQADSVSLENNTTIRQLALQAEQLASAIKVQKYSTLPSLALSFNYSLNAMTNDFNFSEYQWSPYSAVGLSLQIPIFAGGRRANQIRQSQVQYDEFLLQQKNAERQLKIQIRQLATTMETSMKNYAAAQTAYETARKAYDIAVQSYNVGRSTLTDLNDAQLALVQAQMSASQCIYNFVVAKTGLEQVIGIDYTAESE